MRLPRRDFAPPRNDIRFTKAVLNDILQFTEQKIPSAAARGSKVHTLSADPADHSPDRVSLLHKGG